MSTKAELFTALDNYVECVSSDDSEIRRLYKIWKQKSKTPVSIEYFEKLGFKKTPSKYLSYFLQTGGHREVGAYYTEGIYLRFSWTGKYIEKIGKECDFWGERPGRYRDGNYKTIADVEDIFNELGIDLKLEV